MSETESHGVLEDLLDLEELDTNLYRAGNPAEQYMPHLYGGQVAAQALRAAANTVPEGRFPHSIHGYFLRGGRPDRPTIMAVDRDRDGASFSAWHVDALQEGEVIFSALASFHVDEDGVDYQLPNLPADVADPDSMPEHDRPGHNPVFDLRYFSPVEAEPWRASRMWAPPATCSRRIASLGRARSPTSPTWGGRSTTRRQHRYRGSEPRPHGLVPPVGDGEPVGAARPVPGVGREARAACTSERSTTARERWRPRSRRRSSSAHRAPPR